MKSVFIIDDNGKGMEELRTFAREHGYSMIEAGQGVPHASRFSQYVVENSSSQAFWTRSDGRIFYVNNAACRALGYTHDELVKMTVSDIDPNFPPEGYAECWHELREKGTITFETLNRRKDGSVYPVEVRLNHVIFDGREYNCAFATDITERKKAEEALRLSQFAMDNVSIGIFRGEEDGSILYVNECAARMLGYTREELCSMTFFDIVPDMEKQRWRDHRRLLHATGSRKFEAVHRRKDGSIFPVEVSVNYLEFGKERFSCSFSQDITERKKAEEQIRASLVEKTILLKEIHHRVKNNLQIICALLDLNSDSIPDEQTKLIFQSIQDRIRSMALVHEQLYRSSDFASIDLADYIEKLAAYLFNSYVRDPGLISLRVEAEHVSLGLDLSIPCGMIINELVANTLKHAFPAGRKGEVSIELSAGSDGWLTLTIADTGVGFPPGIDIANASTLGLQIVGMLVTQLKGEIDLRNDNGASCVVRFRRTVNS